MDFGEGDAQIRPGQKSQVGFISGIEHIHLFDEIENLEELISEIRQCGREFRDLVKEPTY